MRFRTITRLLISLIALPIMLLALHSRVLAENGCPIGYAPARIPVESSSDCVAIPGYWDESSSDAPAPAEPVWASRWGAIAIGSTATGNGTGFSTNQKSKNAAVKAALQQCLDAKGGETCRSEIFSYQDQCAVVAWGAAAYSAWSAATISEAAALAMERCSKLTEDCQVYYSACSYPVRIR
ncbi:MAG: DUF4189 domain-containing protein [Sphingopyxis sp.]|nr:DUF4189 domain-containing protein [Sphingopyxis sp.]